MTINGIDQTPDMLMKRLEDATPEGQHRMLLEAMRIRHEHENRAEGYTGTEEEMSIWRTP